MEGEGDFKAFLVNGSIEQKWLDKKARAEEKQIQRQEYRKVMRDMGLDNYLVLCMFRTKKNKRVFYSIIDLIWIVFNSKQEVSSINEPVVELFDQKKFHYRKPRKITFFPSPSERAYGICVNT